MPEIMEHILARRSIRAYTAEPVGAEDSLKLLQAAMAAPSASNRRPWEFVVVNDPEVLARLRSGLVLGRYAAPLAIVVCGNMQRALPWPATDFWVEDCSAATQNILLAATGLGLGAVWIGVYPLGPFTKHVSRVLGLPRNVTPLGVVCVGHPAQSRPPRTQYDPRRVHHNTWHVQLEDAPQKGGMRPQEALSDVTDARTTSIGGQIMSKAGGFLEEFKKFVTRGNILDLAVGIAVGGAFGAVVKSFVDDVLMPPIGVLLGNVDFASLFVVLKSGTTPGPYGTLEAAKAAGAATWRYGMFINTVISFVIIAAAVFLLVKAINKMMPKPAPAAPPATKDCPYCLSKVDPKATRCPYCTSQLPG